MLFFSFAVQFALAAGAEVIALTSSSEKMEKLKALGATHVINYKEVQNWEENVREIVRLSINCLLHEADALIDGRTGR
jgi:NADPH:quinone reductase-like Zn-dependent oxidoreductase